MNLETEFLAGPKDDFEPLRDLYRAIKGILQKDYYQWVQANCSFFTDHGQNHIAAVVDTCSLMANNSTKSSPFTLTASSSPLTMVEAFLLLSAILWHDTAMVFGRTNHADNVGKIILKFREFFPHEDFARTVKAIAAAHGGRKGLTKAKKQDYLAFGNSSYEVHPLRLAAFLRLADEISENRTRISGNLLDAVPDQNRIFWEYANAIAWSRPDNEALRLVVSYNVDKKVVVKRFQCVEFPDRCDKDGKLSLIEYIICRLEKINNERIYCAQHLPAFARYTELQARISIVDDLDRLPEFDELSFTFRDGGLYRPGEYPNTSIFDSFFSNNEKWKPENLSKHLN